MNEERPSEDARTAGRGGSRDGGRDRRGAAAHCLRRLERQDAGARGGGRRRRSGLSRLAFPRGGVDLALAYHYDRDAALADDLAARTSSACGFATGWPTR